MLVHGDSHYFKVDKPLTQASGKVIGNFTRVETFGDESTDWVQATIDPKSRDLFAFEPMIVAATATSSRGRGSPSRNFAATGPPQRLAEPLPHRQHAGEQVAVTPHAVEDDVHRERAGSSDAFTSLQRSGVETGAPSFGRTE